MNAEEETNETNETNETMKSKSKKNIKIKPKPPIIRENTMMLPIINLIEDNLDILKEMLSKELLEELAREYDYNKEMENNKENREKMCMIL